MIEVAKEAAAHMMPDVDFKFSNRYSTGSTDMGDLSRIMPVIHPYAAGATGTGHGDNYEIADPEAACVTNAKWQVAMLSLLLENGAARAKEIIATYEPEFESKEAYLAYMDSLNDSGDRIVYREDDVAEIRL